MRILTWLAGALCAVSVTVASPAFGDSTTPGGVPDPGAPPVATGPVVPGATTTPTTSTGTPAVGPLAQQIISQESEVEALGERLTKLDLELAAAQQTTQQTQQALQDARSRADQLKHRADDAAAQVYKQATKLGPWSAYANDVNQLDELVPGGVVDDSSGASGGTQSVVIDAAAAEALAANAQDAYDAALASQQNLSAQRVSLAAERDQKATALANLKSQNSAAVAQAQAAQDAIDAGLAGQFAAGSNSAGQAANPVALKAVAAAMSKRGAPYVWGTEGPDTFDCSGLVWWAYRQAGYDQLPRVAADQYHATRAVPTDQLLAGDLLFFSPTSRTDWTQISHVGMYLGGDYMIEAPSSGDVVKVAHIWWSAFFGATRVVGAVPAPAPPAAAPPPAPPPPVAPAPAPSPAPTVISPRPVPSLPKPPSSAPPPSSTPPSSQPPTSQPPSKAPSSSSTPTPAGPTATASRSASAAASSTG